MLCVNGTVFALLRPPVVFKGENMDHKDSKQHSDHPSMEKPAATGGTQMPHKDPHQQPGKPGAGGSKPSAAGHGDHDKPQAGPSTAGPRNPDAKAGSEKTPSGGNAGSHKQGDGDSDDPRAGGADKKAGQGDRNPFTSGKKGAEATPHGDTKKH
jgi:hypothetical protein